ncbi:MTH1187 family thiamine-binding protein [Mangrovibacillus cuniculi]|uniref:MTH1187 family thiamine-binding protein n=1 Tax=Mangrovibacillus cuniculi TaxID=2593652 RepID=A0A7S8HFT8_9BACI|nr:MTH1187 family thiamine-binding protein [Mangrovibacillus cuniculi]QPC46866.1 MTH1187 family thiamine-binding protein [Mangrovibacillus cuniculi]
MAIVDVTVIPIGTDSPSVSKYVADIQKILNKKKEEGLINFELTPMSTLIEGDLAVVLQVVQEIHEAPFAKGLDRVATNIRIDDRRDKSRKMAQKIEAVQKHLD